MCGYPNSWERVCGQTVCMLTARKGCMPRLFVGQTVFMLTAKRGYNYAVTLWVLTARRARLFVC